MKILQVLNHFLPQKTAGTEIYVWSLSKHLQKMDIQVKVLIPNYGKSYYSDYVYDGLEVCQYPEPSIIDRSLIMGLRVSDGLSYFVEFLKKEKPDLIHFHEISGSNGISLNHIKAAKDLGLKVLMTFHLSGYSCKTDTLLYKGKEICDGVIDIKKCSLCYLNARGYPKLAPILATTSNHLFMHHINASLWNNRLGTALGIAPIISKLKTDLFILSSICDRIIVITKWYKEVLMANGIKNDKISFIPQGLPYKDESVHFKRKHFHHPLKLIYLGRINKLKGLHLLIDALKDIDTNFVSLTIYGNSDDSAYMNDLLKNTLDRKNIRWGGSLEQKDIISTMQQYDVLCLCSTFSEMSPLVIQEAFAARIPVLASDARGNAEQIQNNVNGLLFKFNNVLSLRSQLLKLIYEDGLLQSLQKGIIEPKSFTFVGDKYISLYQTVICSH